MNTNDAKYNSIGKTYNTTRKADLRITDMIINLLNINATATVVDIGAGTGNYSFELAQKGFNILAIEPSQIMREQAKNHRNLRWIKGMAEKLPIKENYADGVICILATHHFSDLTLAFKEMMRILKSNGKLVIFTFDPRLYSENFWISEYFDEIVKDAYTIHPSIESLKIQIEQISNNEAKIIRFPLPENLEDKFFFSGWKHSEWYLDKAFCRGISSLASLTEKKLDDLLNKLRNDLDNGLWKQKHGNILKFDAGYYFIVASKES